MHYFCTQIYQEIKVLVTVDDASTDKLVGVVSHASLTLPAISSRRISSMVSKYIHTHTQEDAY